MKVRAKVDLFHGGYRRKQGAIFDISGEPSKHMEVIGGQRVAADDQARRAKKAAASLSEINAETADAEKQAMTGKVSE